MVNKVNDTRGKMIFFAVAAALVILISGCAGKKEMKKDPFFEEWKIIAEKSRGQSPTARVKSIEIPAEPGLKKGESPLAERPLPTDKVNLKMRNTGIKMVIRALARAARHNILIKSDVEGQISVDFKDVPWDRAFLSILRSQALTYERDGSIIRIVNAKDMKDSLELKSLEETKREKAPLMTMVIPVNFADTEKLGANMTDFLTKDEKGNPCGSIKISEHTNSLIIHSSREDMKKIVVIIEKIDRPTPQILIEANIVETTKNTARNLGIQWGGMYAPRIGNHNLYVTPGGTSGTGASGGLSPAQGGYNPLYGSSGVSGHGYGVNFPAAGMSATGAGSLGLMFGTIGGNILDMQLNALQGDGKLNILSRPSITTLDNQKAVTENGTKVPYVTVDEDGNREVRFEDAVLRLEITPHVIDGKNLKMQILVEKNEVDEVESHKVDGNPRIIKKRTETQLIVQDNETIVISGLSRQKKTDSSTGVPGFKNIPLLGWLFRSKGESEDMEEVLIFITPHILKTLEEKAGRAEVPEQQEKEGRHSPEQLPHSEALPNR